MNVNDSLSNYNNSKRDPFDGGEKRASPAEQVYIDTAQIKNSNTVAKTSSSSLFRHFDDSDIPAKNSFDEFLLSVKFTQQYISDIEKNREEVKVDPKDAKKSYSMNRKKYFSDEKIVDLTKRITVMLDKARQEVLEKITALASNSASSDDALNSIAEADEAMQQLDAVDEAIDYYTQQNDDLWADWDAISPYIIKEDEGGKEKKL